MVFGAGGDRDAGKRPIMGRIAAENADRVIVTDDNPRSEQPAAIRAAILAAAPGATEIGDRAEAIRAGIAALQAGDVLLIAGKGHETGQIVGDNDFAVFRPRRGRRGAARKGGMSALWTIDAMAAAMRAEKSGALPADVPRPVDRHPHASARATRSSPSRATTATATTSSRPRSKPAPGSRSSRATSARDLPPTRRC